MLPRLLSFVLIGGAALLLSIQLVSRSDLPPEPANLSIAAPRPSASAEQPDQAAASSPSSDAGVAVSRVHPLSAALCPRDMLLVAFAQCADVRRACRDSATTTPCAVYASQFTCVGGRRQQRFCVDRFEYPNLKGAVAATMVSFGEARQACEWEGKRLCRVSEWSAACEGPSHLPFPYGNRHIPGACNLGQTTETHDLEALWDPRRTVAELNRLDFRWDSGFGGGCRSSTGSVDLVGNVQEWALSEVSGYEAALMGGHYGLPWMVCRAAKNVHHSDVRLAHTGFRCCADPIVPLPAE